MKVIDVAIIIPTLNEQDYIGVLLDSLAMQTVKPKEIVIVDASSKDHTASEVKKRMPLFPSLQFFVVPKKTIAWQRNVGVSQTSAPHILFLDADMKLWKKDTLAKIWQK